MAPGPTPSVSHARLEAIASVYRTSEDTLSPPLGRNPAPSSSIARSAPRSRKFYGNYPPMVHAWFTQGSPKVLGVVTRCQIRVSEKKNRR